MYIMRKSNILPTLTLVCIIMGLVSRENIKLWILCHV